jgi:hypothetical protein
LCLGPFRKEAVICIVYFEIISIESDKSKNTKRYLICTQIFGNPWVFFKISFPFEIGINPKKNITLNVF